MGSHFDVYKAICKKVGIEEDIQYHSTFNPKDPWGESLHYLALRNFKRFITVVYYLIKEKKYVYDVVVGGGDSGVGVVKVTEMIFEHQKLPKPPMIYLPIIRWMPKWFEYKGQPTELFDNSIHIPAVRKELQAIHPLQRVLFVDDEINKGYTAKAAVTVILNATHTQKNVQLDIVATDQKFDPEDFIKNVNCDFYPFAEDVKEISNVISYVVPWSIEKHLREGYENDEISSKARFNSLLGLPSKEYERFEDHAIEKPVFSYRQLEQLQNNVTNFKQLQADFERLINKWIDEAIAEYEQ